MPSIHALARSARTVAAVVALISLSCVACTRTGTATITRTDGTELEATILGRDATHLVVEPEGGGQPVRVAHGDIEDIDHPGNVEMVAGIGLATAGVIPTAIGAALVAGNDANGMALVFGGMCALAGVALLVPGIYMATEGGIQWTTSTDAAETDRTHEVQLGLAPWVAPHGRDVATGAGVIARW